MSEYILKSVCIAGSLILTAVIFQLIRKRKLREEYGLIWVGGALIILAVSCFVNPLGPVVILLVGLPLTLFIILTQSVKLSAHQDCIRDLAQYTALLEWRLQQLEEEKRPFSAETFSNGVPVTPQPHPFTRRQTADEFLNSQK